MTGPQLSREEQIELNDWLNEDRFKLEIPIVFSYLLEEQKDHNETIIEATLRVRESKEARAFRKVCAQFDEAARVGISGELRRIIKEMAKATEKLNIKYQAPTLDSD